ncbi:caspase 20, apoptosis-related cysteine peptidase [Tachysurus fulvidraco]|uniref:caspase 20, apoptosis-related cysteine peptidase n=1 Tax=Tachysurus fulvidraco TaxID=1234273 RepID=UPI000F4D7A06|nr:caspase 20, apoptosis-related cysteine peptidase [Tachysurus fulvidraco]XP_047669288.1 caspase 20, apoptosis-related cysteine peptidase [Tachysurus fulvidraco]
MQSLLEKKVFLISTLSADPAFILQHVQQDKIITQREYNNLNHINHTLEKIVTNLLDTVMSKGDASCRKFMNLLQQKEVQDTFPVLKELFIPTPTSHKQDNKVKAGDEINEYKMSSVPRGHCLIINNITFESPRQVRNGSILDEESLKKVFQWLGFSLHVYRNQTAEQMKVLLKTFNQKHHDGDCFVCCILSHGSKDGVLGTDRGIISKDDICGPFSGNLCPSLVNKPKVFFIQACRGDQHQQAVEVQSDSYGEDMEMEMEDKESLELDSFEITTIPSDADFLVVWSSTNGCVSIRETASGSWFIQSLCEQLKTHCPKGEDVPSILLRVNNEVGGKTARIRYVAPTKQMPVHEVTLRKKLVFPVLNL